MLCLKGLGAAGDGLPKGLLLAELLKGLTSPTDDATVALIGIGAGAELAPALVNGFEPAGRQTSA